MTRYKNRRGKTRDFSEPEYDPRPRRISHTKAEATPKTIEITPKGENQEEYVRQLQSKANDIVIGIGPAGTGKTMLAAQVAASMLTQGLVKSIVIVRPAVTVDDEQHGFLPGNLTEKMSPWVRPVIQQLRKVYSSYEIDRMLKDEVIHLCPLAFMRGLTLDDCFILMDEAQNTTVGQMKMLLTRIGNRSKMGITGDLDQTDRLTEENGLEDLLDRLDARPIDRISVVEFNNGDIQRNPIISKVLEAYGND